MAPKKKSKLDYLIPVLLVLLAFYFALHGAVAYDIAQQYPVVRETYAGDTVVQDESFNLALFVEEWGNLLNDPLGIEITKSTGKALGICSFVCFIGLAYYYTTRKKYITGKEYGTADWGTEKTIAHLKAKAIAATLIGKVKYSFKSKKAKNHLIEGILAKYEQSDKLFTTTEAISIHNFEVNGNTLLIGGSGSGKSRGFFLPNILQANSSFVITDPKGELLWKTGKFLEDLGYNIRVLNLDEKNFSNCYNPFFYVHRERDGWEERVLSLIETIIMNTDGGEKKGGTDPFWDKAERLFLQSIFFFTVEAFPREESNLNTALKLIEMLRLEEERDNYDSDLDLMFQVFEERYGSQHIAVRQFKEFRSKASGKTAKSIVISAVARLAPFKVQQVQEIFSADTMQLDRIGEEKTAIFVIVPPTDKTFNFISGMVFTQLFSEINHCALNVHKKDGKRLPVYVQFLLDEFATTCTIPNFVDLLAYARSLGVGISIGIQSLEQIKNMYKDEWGVILDNCNTLLFLGGIRNMDTLEYISKLVGKGTFDKRNYSRTKGRQGSSSTSYDKLGRELMDAAEIQKMGKKDCLFFVTGYNPFYSKKYIYEQHPNYKHTVDADPNNIYEYTPERPRLVEFPVSEEKEAHPHGEDEPPARTVEEPAALIEWEMDESVIQDNLNRTLLSWNIMNGEVFVFPDEEPEFSVEETLEIILDEEMSSELDAAVLGNAVANAYIDFDASIESVADTAQSMIAGAYKGELNLWSPDESYDCDVVHEIEEGVQALDEGLFFASEEDVEASFSEIMELADVNDILGDMADFEKTLNGMAESDLLSLLSDEQTA